MLCAGANPVVQPPVRRLSPRALAAMKRSRSGILLTRKGGVGIPGETCSFGIVISTFVAGGVLPWLIQGLAVCERLGRSFVGVAATAI